MGWEIPAGSDRALTAGPHRVIGPLAGETGGSGSVSMRRKLSRSVINPALQVGEQSAGGSGWRACGGSAGTRAGVTLGGDGSDGV